MLAVKFPEYERSEGSSYLPINRDAIAEIAADMARNGYDESQPIIVKGIRLAPLRGGQAGRGNPHRGRMGRGRR